MSIQASCINSYAYSSLKLLYTSCSGCSGAFCQICTDFSNSVHVGYNCTQCTLNALNTGFCRSCSICTPVQITAACRNTNKRYLYLNASSCQGCNKTGSITLCSICFDQKVKKFNGTQCGSCYLTNSTNQTGYCEYC